MKLESCKTCIIASFLIGVATILVTLSAILLAFTFHASNKVDEAAKELEAIKKEYVSIINGFKKIQNFSPDYYQNGIYYQKNYDEVVDTLKEFKNVFIALSILISKNGTLEESLSYWKMTHSLDGSNTISNYGLGLAYFRLATETKLDKQKEKLYLDSAIKYLSHHSLSSDGQAQYHIALANLRSIEHETESSRKYVRARKAIDTLKDTDAKKHPLGNVDRNAALAFCLGSKYTTDTKLKQELKIQSEIYFALIKDIQEFSDFYTKHYDNCIMK